MKKNNKQKQNGSLDKLTATAKTAATETITSL